MNKAHDDLISALSRLMGMAANEGARLRHEARDSTSGVARALLECAQRWEDAYDTGQKAITKADTV